MVRIGYTVVCEQAGPRQLVADVRQEMPAEAVEIIRPEEVAASIPCGGGDVDEFVQAVRAYADAGFTEVALFQVGGDAQRPFLDWAHRSLLPALREL